MTTAIASATRMLHCPKPPKSPSCTKGTTRCGRLTATALAGRVGEKDKSPAGEDLPPEAAEKLAELRKALEEFIDAQHKAIEAWIDSL